MSQQSVKNEAQTRYNFSLLSGVRFFGMMRSASRCQREYRAWSYIKIQWYDTIKERSLHFEFSSSPCSLRASGLQWESKVTKAARESSMRMSFCLKRGNAPTTVVSVQNVAVINGHFINASHFVDICRNDTQKQ